MFVKVAIPIPSSTLFAYVVPDALAPLAAVGKQVLVPFGRKRLSGWIVEILPETPPDRVVREIIELSDAEPLFGGEELAFCEWISRYYIHPLGRVLAEVLPGGTDLKSDRWLRLSGSPADGVPLSAGQQEILRQLAAFPEGLPLGRLRKRMGAEDLYRDLSLLETAGLLASEERLKRPAVRTKREKWIGLNPAAPVGIKKLTLKQEALISLLEEAGELPLADLPDRLREAAFIRTIAQKGFITLQEKEVSRGAGPSPKLARNGDGIAPNAAQETALTEIRARLAAGAFSPFLLHGVTGSGKTEVYLRAIAGVLQAGGGAIYLVPEIALTTQLLSRISARFPDREIAVLHSGITLGARYDQWRRIRNGELSLVVGARSAIFAPVRNLRLIVVDEEHDPSFKQDDRLRHNARDLALVRGKSA
ncbi:MAG: DEAD/DEAH box helicase, partial [Deltaproteobacteria bacterium]|nr:DEAD/DEAH box helicase [Deltaproteobacteria bacterium]